MQGVFLVPTNHVFQAWDSFEKYLADALVYAHGDITIDQLKADIGQGRATLCAFVDEKPIGAAAIVFQNRRNSRVAFVLAIGGRGLLAPWCVEQFMALLKKEGATRVEGVGRDSIVRLWQRLGFRKKHTVFELAL